MRVPSVTEVLGLAGLTDFSGIPLNVLANARDRGSLVHDWCDLIDKGVVDPEEPIGEEAQGYVDAYLKFKAETGFELVASEEVVVCEAYRYAGTLDRLGYMRKLKHPEALTCVDLKCVALVSPATALQVAGYAYADPRDIQSTASLQLRGNGTYRLARYWGEENLHDWIAAVRLAHFKLRAGMAPPLED